MKNYMMIDGEKIEISDATAAEFKKKFGEKTLKDRVQEYINETPFGYGGMEAGATIISYGVAHLVRMKLPPSNDGWYWAAFEYMRNLVNHFGTGWEDGLCLVSGHHTPNEPSTLYVRIGEED